MSVGEGPDERRLQRIGFRGTLSSRNKRPAGRSRPVEPKGALEAAGCKTRPTSSSRTCRRATTARRWSSRTSISTSPRGEFLTMLGPSGSGKTTCLMMLAGFETATHGEIVLDGEPINNVPPHKRHIGMVFQNYALFPHMTVDENLAFPLEVRRLAKAEIEERVQQGPGHGPARRLRQPPAGPALGRPAAAGRGRPRAGVRAQARADGRAAGRARQAAARADAVRDQAHPREPGRHRGLRDPRPERSADHVEPDRGLQRRRDPAAGDALPTSTSGRRTRSSPSSSARTTGCAAR